MTRPYSADLRERVVRSVEAGASCRATAATFEVSVAFVVKVIERWHRSGSVAPARYGGWEGPPLTAHAERIVALVIDNPDLTLDELRGRLAADGIQDSRSALGRFLLAHGLTRKKARGAESETTSCDPFHEEQRALYMSMPTVSGGPIDGAAGTSHGGCRVRSSSS